MTQQVASRKVVRREPDSNISHIGSYQEDHRWPSPEMARTSNATETTHHPSQNSDTTGKRRVIRPRA